MRKLVLLVDLKYSGDLPSVMEGILNALRLLDGVTDVNVQIRHSSPE